MEELTQIFIFIIALVIIGNFFGYLKDRARAKISANRFDAESVAKVERELAAIKQRLEILERIVTDRKFQLHDEINNL